MRVATMCFLAMTMAAQGQTQPTPDAPVSVAGSNMPANFYPRSPCISHKRSRQTARPAAPNLRRLWRTWTSNSSTRKPSPSTSASSCMSTMPGGIRSVFWTPRMVPRRARPPPYRLVAAACQPIFTRQAPASSRCRRIATRRLTRRLHAAAVPCGLCTVPGWTNTIGKCTSSIRRPQPSTPAQKPTWTMRSVTSHWFKVSSVPRWQMPTRPWPIPKEIS